MLRYWYILNLIILALLTSTAATSYFSTYINSDYLYGYETATNLIHFGFNGQDFPSAPYYFPDLLIVILLTTITSNITVINFIYSVLFVLISTYLIYRVIKLTDAPQNKVLLGTVLSASFFFIIPSGMPSLREWPLSHLSVLVFSLYFLHYYIKQRLKPISYPLLVLNLLLTYFVFVSDNLLLIQLLIPFVLMLGYGFISQSTINKKFSIILLCGLLTVTALTALTPFGVEKYLHASFTSNSHLLRIRHIGEFNSTLQHVLQLLITDIKANPLFYFMLGIYHCIAVTGFLHLYRQHKVFRFIWIFLYLSQIINLCLAVLSGKIVETAHFRYMYTLFLYPAIAAGLVISLSQLNRLAWVILAYCAGAFFVSNDELLRSFSFSTPYTETLACIDDTAKKYSVSNGLSEYWYVRYIRDLSKNGIMVSQVNRRLELYNFIDNKNLLYANAKPTSPLQYQFIIANNLPVKKIPKKLGKPDKIVNCSGVEMWLYLTNKSQTTLNSFVNASRT